MSATSPKKAGFPRVRGGAPESKQEVIVPHTGGGYPKSIFLFGGGIPFYAFNTNGNRGIPHIGGGIPKGIACGLNNLQFSPFGWE